MMKDRWKNNLGLKVVAVLFAIFLWWTVVNVDDPVKTQKYTTEVTVLNPEVITNNGKSYQIVDDTKNIVVTVKARRKVLEQIKSSNIIATADLQERQDTSVPIRISIQGFEGSYIEASPNPRNIQVQVEDTQKKTFPINVVTTGTVRDGYVLDKTNTVAVPQSIDISGPQSSLGRISRVVAKVDVSELWNDTELKAELIYYDSADNIIDQSLLSSNCDINGVSVQVKLLQTKNVLVKFDTSQIIPADGYVFKEIEVEPQYIEVAGKSETLNATSALEVSADALKREGISKNEEVLINMTDYLPDGIILADDTAGSVVVRIVVEKAGTKSILLPTRSIKINNASEEFEITFGSEQEVELRFEGANDILDSLTSEKFIATIDLAELKEEGTYNVPVQVAELPDQCAYLGETTVQITLKKK